MTRATMNPRIQRLSDPGDTVVLIYHASNPESENQLTYLKKVALKFEKYKNVIDFSRLNADKNDIPDEYDFSGSVQWYLVKQSAKDRPVRYEGVQEIREIQEWIIAQNTVGAKIGFV